MEIIKVDDCIKSIKLENNTILYYRTRLDCEYVENNDNRNEYYFEQIPQIAPREVHYWSRPHK